MRKIGPCLRQIWENSSFTVNWIHLVALVTDHHTKLLLHARVLRTHICMYSDLIFTSIVLDIILQSKQNFLLYKSVYSLNHQNFKKKTYPLGLGCLQSQLVQNLWTLYLHFHCAHLKLNEYNNFNVYVHGENSSLFINFELEIHWAKNNIKKSPSKIFYISVSVFQDIWDDPDKQVLVHKGKMQAVVILLSCFSLWQILIFAEVTWGERNGSARGCLNTGSHWQPKPEWSRE